MEIGSEERNKELAAMNLSQCTYFVDTEFAHRGVEFVVLTYPAGLPADLIERNLQTLNVPTLEMMPFVRAKSAAAQVVSGGSNWSLESQHAVQLNKEAAVVLEKAGVKSPVLDLFLGIDRSQSKSWVEKS